MPTVNELLKSALAFHRAGDLKTAVKDYTAVLVQQPNQLEALHMLGLLYHQQGDHAQALHWLNRASTVMPDAALILINRASVYLSLSRYAEAEADARRAMECDASAFGAWFNHGLALLGLKRDADAAKALKQASALRPQHARAWLEWVTVAVRSGQVQGLAEKNMELPPSLAMERHLALQTATVLERGGQANLAFTLLTRLRTELPHDSEVRYRYAHSLQYYQRSGELMAELQVVLEREPEHRNARLLRANILRDRGEAEIALIEYGQLIEQAPGDADAGSAYLLALQHIPNVDAARVAAAHRTWAVRHAPIRGQRWAVSLPHADPERSLRIGWLSPRFFAGLATTFFAGTLENLNHSRMHHVLYDSSAVDDVATARFRAAADSWRTVNDLDDDALCAQIRADHIDILVELSGHSPGNRLLALAARPAPVQISWMDYFHSTGLDTINFLLSDIVLSPFTLAKNYTERILYLSSGRLCYEPPTGAPAVSTRQTGPIRFACFNRLSKINDTVLSAWARILASIPKSLLRLKCSAFDDADMRVHFLARCARHGIAAERLELLGFGTHVETLVAYSDVDIALDPFPFSGCATTCDALWMGVPVVTMLGETMVSRQSASLLHTIGLPELIVRDVDDYVRRAQALAGDVVMRQSLRTNLRAQMQERLCNAKKHAAEVSAALREAWQSWCRGELN